MHYLLVAPRFRHYLPSSAALVMMSRCQHFFGVLANLDSHSAVAALLMISRVHHFFGVLAQLDSHSCEDPGRDIAGRAARGKKVIVTGNVDFCLA